ncbi:hypothetical protein LshimejAT787_1002830 [Lyophyllum shimeji]|uniref:Uncharacterized protein n=1 Tax=Lyophyllum shimeji TaxID=47721 RepID=A0A9P3PTD2_LYOSH|nr:hypothetical protein LshimejAT787_1002830 [Lyophyllum shimeji]
MLGPSRQRLELPFDVALDGAKSRDRRGHDFQIVPSGTGTHGVEPIPPTALVDQPTMSSNKIAHRGRPLTIQALEQFQDFDRILVVSTTCETEQNRWQQVLHTPDIPVFDGIGQHRLGPLGSAHSSAPWQRAWQSDQELTWQVNVIPRATSSADSPGHPLRK